MTETIEQHLNAVKLRAIPLIPTLGLEFDAMDLALAYNQKYPEDHQDWHIMSGLLDWFHRMHFIKMIGHNRGGMCQYSRFETEERG